MSNSRTLEEAMELLGLLDDEGMVGQLVLHRGPNARWAAWTERSIKSFDLPEEILMAANVLSEYLPSSIHKIELVRQKQGKLIDRLKISREV